VSIEERPEKVNNRREIGHWEMDCVVGEGSRVFARDDREKGRFELIFKLKHKTQDEVVKAINRIECRHGASFRGEKFKSITMDNGCEFLDFERIEKSIFSGKKRTKCYFAHPYSSWERGSKRWQTA